MRYQKIYSQIWNDEKFTRLTPSQQRLFLYILTCPHGNIIGFFVLKKGYVCDDLKSLPKDFEKDLRKLIESGLIEYDFDTSIVLIKKFLKHNPLTNPNQIKAAKNLLKELPNTKLFHRFIEVLPEVLKEELNEVLKEVLPKPDTDTDTDTEERENIYICAREYIYMRTCARNPLSQNEIFRFCFFDRRGIQKTPGGNRPEEPGDWHREAGLQHIGQGR